MFEFLLPDVGEGIAEAELLEWLVGVGDTVAEGDSIAVVNTDKVTVELPSPVDGTVIELPWTVGDVIPVGRVLVRFGSDTTPASEVATESAGVAGSTIDGSPDSSVEIVSRAVERPGMSTAVSPQMGRIVAAPSTRALAAAKGIDLREVRGSGPGGRILRSDLDTGVEVDASQHAEVHDAPSGAGTRRLSGLRLLSARNLALSRAQTVTCTTTFEIRAEGVANLLGTLKSSGTRVTVPAVIAKCAAHALGKHLHLNGWIVDDGDALHVQESVDVAFAVATENGLAVPIVRDVGSRTLRTVAAELEEISQRAQSNRLHPDEQRNGTFTVSSTGSLERARILSTTPVINYPQVTTLWVGRMLPCVRVDDDGVIETGHSMVASLSFDHRFIDGADATAFINDLAAAIEEPTVAIA